MLTPPADSANEPAELHSIRCPYCDEKVYISLRTVNGTRLPVEKAELKALPYARDVNIFDPPIGHANSRWSRVGEDFLGGLKYDRLFGILRIPHDLTVYYCVACCPECGARTEEQIRNNSKRGLIDVFANLSKDTTYLSGIWPQLFSADPHDQLRLFTPRDLLSRFFGNSGAVVTILLFLYASSFIPDIALYLHQMPQSLSAFLTAQFPALIIRGIMVLSLFLLIVVRMRLIRLFTDEAAFAKLFKLQTLQRKKGLIYWMNWAVSRFTGYQKPDNLVTFNSVLFFGGIISAFILLVAWALSSAAIIPSGTHMTVYAAGAELVFWFIVSFLFGVIVWNQFEIPHYILPSLERIPMQAVPTHSFIRNFGIIIQIGIYSACGILLLCTTFIAVMILPVLIPGFPEPQFIVVWAQFALVVFYSIIIVRFVQQSTAVKVFAYFFFKLYGITCNSIRKTYVEEIIQEAERDREKHQHDKDPTEYVRRHEKVETLKKIAETHIIPLERITRVAAIIAFLILVATFLIDILTFFRAGG